MSLRRFQWSEGRSVSIEDVFHMLRECRQTDVMDFDGAWETLLEVGPSDTELLPYLLAGLRDSGKEVRLWCVIGLERVGDSRPPVVPELLRMLDDKDPEVRAKATRALGILGSAEARTVIPALSKKIKKVFDVDLGMRYQALIALRRLAGGWGPAFRAIFARTRHGR